jgi:hydrogenase maturation protease
VERGIAIIGVGNASMGDDGIGVYLVEKLREELSMGRWSPACADRIQLVNAGSDAVLAGACLAESERTLLVDAADMKAQPGDFRVFAPADSRVAYGASGSAHVLPLGQVLEMIGDLGLDSRFRIMGVQIGEVRAGAGLSPRVLARVPEMLEKIKEEVSLLS